MAPRGGAGTYGAAAPFNQFSGRPNSGRHRADHARDLVIGRDAVDVLRAPISIGQLQGYRRAPTR